MKKYKMMMAMDKTILYIIMLLVVSSYAVFALSPNGSSQLNTGLSENKHISAIDYHTDGSLYLAGENASFYAYNVTSGVLSNYTNPSLQQTNYPFSELSFSDTDAYVVGDGFFIYHASNNSITRRANIFDDAGGFWERDSVNLLSIDPFISDVIYDPSRNIAWIGGADDTFFSTFGYYNVSSDTFINVSEPVRSVGSTVTSLAYDSNRNIVYIVGLGVYYYNPDNQSIYPLDAPSNIYTSSYYDVEDDRLYIGSGFGALFGSNEFGYTSIGGEYVNISSDGNLDITSEPVGVTDIDKDTDNGGIYITGNINVFADDSQFTPSGKGFLGYYNGSYLHDLTGQLPFTDRSYGGIAYDPNDRLLYISGEHGAFISYNSYLNVDSTAPSLSVISPANGTTVGDDAIPSLNISISVNESSTCILQNTSQVFDTSDIDSIGSLFLPVDDNTEQNFILDITCYDNAIPINNSVSQLFVINVDTIEQTLSETEGNFEAFNQSSGSYLTFAISVIIIIFFLLSIATMWRTKR